MSKDVVSRLQAEFSGRILETSAFRGDDEVVVGKTDWKTVAFFLKNHCAMDHFVDITAVDWPERDQLPRFDVLLFVRSMSTKHRIRVRTRIGDGDTLPTLTDVWPGANWGEREVFDMFGIRFDDHPDLRRILMYDEFVGHPLRKDYPIAKAQPLVPYRTVEDIDKLPPFGPEEGQPWGRIDWDERLSGRDVQVSPAIGEQVGQRPMLSKGPEYEDRVPVEE